MEETTRVALVVGAGDGLGAAIARRFAAEGLLVCVVRRNGAKLAPLVSQIEAAGGRARAFEVDARSEEQTAQLFGQVAELGVLEVCVFNIGANVRHAILDTTARVYFKVWQMAAFAGFLTAKEAARAMLPQGAGTILFTGATASTRGAPGYAAFAGAKAALRALAQAMAKELGPRGVHVAHVVIDGPVDGAFVRSLLPEETLCQHETDGRERPLLLNPEHVADAFVALHRQHRDAWTFELDLRPCTERW